MAVIPVQPFIGGRYELHEMIGAGGMGQVYRATDRLTNTTVALKRVTALDPDVQIVDSQLRRALAQEFRLLATLHHPNIITVIDYGFDAEQQPYYTMELLPATVTLIEAGRSADRPQQIHLLVQTLQALAYLHRRGIVHHDLKPENVLVSGDQVRVLDFGLSVALAYRSSEKHHLVGTLTYIAPELFSENTPSPASDLYAVGVMAYEMLTGAHPFTQDDVVGFINDVLTTPADVRAIQPLAVAEIIARLLAKDPLDRFADASAVSAALAAAVDAPLPVESGAIRESYLQAAAFVGRSEERQQLTEALVNARGGRGSAWLVGGESGVGKSRLLDELRAEALVSGVLVLHGQGIAGGGRLYHLWHGPLRRLLLASDVSDLDAGILKDIVPDIADLLQRPVSDAPKLDAESHQQRLVRTVVSLFEQQTGPVMLLVEDLHWLDESLTILQALARAAPTLPLLIVGSYRSDEVPRLPARLPDMPVILLTRLDRDQIADLTASMLGDQIDRPGDVVDFLQRETEGNVFFIVEVMRALAENAGSLNDIGRRTLPAHVFAGGVRQLVQRRLQRLPDDARPLLKRVAVAGRWLDFRVIDFLLARQPDLLAGSLDDWLATCANLAVLDVREGAWRFAHDKLREGVLHTLTADEQPMLHREIAVAIEAVYADDTAQALPLVEHWRAANDAEKSVHYLRLAAENALNVSAYSEGLRLVQTALDLLPPAESVPRRDHRRVRLLNLRGRLYMDAGAFTDALEAYEASHELARRQGDRIGVSRALTGIGSVYWHRGDYARSQSYLEGSITLARALGDRAGLLRALNMLGFTLYFLGEYARAQRIREDCLTLARELGDLPGEADALNGLGVIAKEVGDYEAAMQYHSDSLAIKQQIGDQGRVASSLGNMGVVAFEQGDYARARALHQRAQLIHLDLGVSRRIAIDSLNLAACSLMLGDFTATIGEGRDAVRRTYALGNKPLLDTALVALAGGVVGAAESGVAHPERADSAARLVGAATALRASGSYVLASEDRALITHVERALRSVLGEAAYTSAHSAGAAMCADDAVAYALRVTADLV